MFAGITFILCARISREWLGVYGSRPSSHFIYNYSKITENTYRIPIPPPPPYANTITCITLTPPHPNVLR